MKARRCAIPVDGYYEWLSPEKPGGRKRPFFVHDATCASPSPDVPAIAGELGRLHERLPVPLGDEAALSAWLDPQKQDATRLVAEAVAHAYDSLAEWEMHEVDPAVGNVRNNGPELIMPIDEIEPPLF